MEDFKCLSVLFKSGGRMEQEMYLMNVLCRGTGLNLRDEVWCPPFMGESRLQPLLLHIKSPLRWFDHQIKIPLDASLWRFSRYVFLERGRPRTYWGVYILSGMGTPWLGITQGELRREMSVA